MSRRYQALRRTGVIAATLTVALSVGASPALAVGWFTFANPIPVAKAAPPATPTPVAKTATGRPVDVRDPSAPGAVSVTAISQTSATISWAPATDDTGISSYEYWLVGGAHRYLTGTSYTETALQPSTRYDIVIVATDTVGKHSSAAVGNFTTAAPTVTAVNTGAQIPITSCPVQPAVRAFAAFGDPADYSQAPDGGFENNASGWTLTRGAAVQSGNEDLGVTSGTKSLIMPAGAIATSPRFCVDQSNPSFRFAVKANCIRSGVDAIVLYRDSAGSLTDVQFTSSAADWDNVGDWVPSASSPLATHIPLLSSQPTASVQLMFASRNRSVIAGSFQGSVSIDSVMVDPYRRG